MSAESCHKHTIDTLNSQMRWEPSELLRPDSQSFQDRAQGAPNTAVTFRVDALLTLSDLQKLVRRVIASQTPFGDQFVEHVLS